MIGLTIDDLRPATSTQFFVKPDEAQAMSGPIILPTSVTSYNPNWYATGGTVIKVGAKVREVKVGDRVRFERYEGKALVVHPTKSATFRERYFVFDEAADKCWGVESRA